MSDTIAALASGQIPAGVAVIRVSGPTAFAIVDKVTNVACQSQGHATARLIAIHSTPDYRLLDNALRIVFCAPKSFTGEDVVELHVHGGLVVIDEVLEQLYAAGARPANRGEFTERAFINGKIDLIQAEAIADIIAAPTRSARELATLQLGGLLSRRINTIEQSIQSARVLVEASIDFPEDVGDVDVNALTSIIHDALRSLQALHETARRGQLLRKGAVIVLLGAPNVGKSSLLNALVGKERAIVSPIAGTTRDTIDVQIDLSGIPVTLTDTAGLRDSADEIERIGIDRTRSSAHEADIILALDSVGTPRVALPTIQESTKIIHVQTKADLLNIPNDSGDTYYVSALTGFGIDDLIDGIRQSLLDDALSSSLTDAIAINARHAALITNAIEALKRVIVASSANVPADLLAVELNDAAFHLASISGRDVIEAMHQEIFSRFCIGK
ncbi:MAG: tRNA uridine-5-carboxymethylaminomethyl(34) synthesis GTPase MnmE [Armatimonadota bacterium]